ncbi:MAG: nucleotidyltransferase family protein [Acidobacteria bacterium]|nr:nucleotidyltransferase family protein [Acidobacteriota bacterium]
MISALVLAAGASSRMGTPKPLLEFDGRTCLDLVVSACLEGGAGEAIVVVGSGAAGIRTAIERRAGVRFVVNEDPGRGQTSSLKAGLAAVPPGAAGFFVLPADHPLLRGRDIAILRERFQVRAPEKSIIIPSFEGRRGHPLLMAIAHREPLLGVGDDAPLRDYVRAREPEIETVAAESAAVLSGINTPEEYLEAVAEYRRRGRHSPP